MLFGRPGADLPIEFLAAFAPFRVSLRILRPRSMVGAYKNSRRRPCSCVSPYFLEAAIDASNTSLKPSTLLLMACRNECRTSVSVIGPTGFEFSEAAGSGRRPFAVTQGCSRSSAILMRVSWFLSSSRTIRSHNEGSHSSGIGGLRDCLSFADPEVRMKSTHAASLISSYISTICPPLPNGSWPSSMQYSVTPSCESASGTSPTSISDVPMAQMSAAVPRMWSTGLPQSSGLAKAGLPMALDELSSPGRSNMAETPKSVILHVFWSDVSRMLSGLMSWSVPLEVSSVLVVALKESARMISFWWR